MNSLKKIFQKSDNDQKVSLKHSKSMPYLSSPDRRNREPPRDDLSKPTYHGKTPLQKSDIVYVEQAGRVLDIHHGELSMPQYTNYHGPTRKYVHTRMDSLAKFPHSPEPTEGLPRRGFRPGAVSLNSRNDNPQIPTYNSGPSGQQAYPSTPCRTQRYEATVDQFSAQRIRAKSSTDRANIPPSRAPAPPLPTTRALHQTLSRSAHSSRANIRRVPSHAAVRTPAPAYPRSYWPYSQFDEISHERDPDILREMINRYPLAPASSARCPRNMRPMYFDMDEPGCLEKTIQLYIHMALAERRPLDARAGGRYHRIVDFCHMGIDPETGADLY
ncbi:hypothetical protein EDD22DRAFT_546639 [Suillus occidentalis]|nr:hypothetical protein EDD22DRAFT_546639 [Suillus occidentalis]